MTQLKAELPPFGDASLSFEDQARSVLHILLEESEAFLRLGEDPRCCPNCDVTAESLSSPYCSEKCRSQASFVRQFRAALATASILTPDKQVVFGERLWWLLGGGLPLRESRILESGKRQVVKRCGGKCEFCGAPMTDIQNFGSGCNRPLHLRAVCANCSRTKPFGDLAFSQSPEVVMVLTDLSQRINAATPIRPCDDPEAWDWRAFLAQRRTG